MQTLIEIRFPDRHEPEDPANLEGYLIEAKPVRMFTGGEVVEFARFEGLDIPIVDLKALPIVRADKTPLDMIVLDAIHGQGKVAIFADGSLEDLCKLPRAFLLYDDGAPEAV